MGGVTQGKVAADPGILPQDEFCCPGHILHSGPGLQRALVVPVAAVKR